MAKKGKDTVKSDKEKAKAERQSKQQKRKNAQVANKNRQKNDDKQRGGLKEYFKGVRVETKKVVWPTRKELMSYTVVVLFTCAFFGLAIWGIDSGFLALLKLIFNIHM